MKLLQRKYIDYNMIRTDKESIEILLDFMGLFRVFWDYLRKIVQDFLRSSLPLKPPFLSVHASYLRQELGA